MGKDAARDIIVKEPRMRVYLYQRGLFNNSSSETWICNKEPRYDLMKKRQILDVEV
jgi:hypothetical protein